METLILIVTTGFHGFPGILGEDVTKHVTGHYRSEGMNDSVCMTYVRISVGYQQ
jgi:hypothetical protein